MNLYSRDEPQCFHLSARSHAPLDGPRVLHGVDGAILNLDRASDAQTLLVDLPPGWKGVEDSAEGSLEMFILQGTLQIDAVQLSCGGYFDIPQASNGASLATLTGALAIALWTPNRRQFPPPYSAVTALTSWQEHWVPSIPGAHGIMHKSLRKPDFSGEGFDGGPGGYLRLFFLAPGTSDSMEHVHHECWEGVITLAGDIMQANEAIATQGVYLGHPAGFFHAPIASHAGCVMLVQTDAPMGFPWPRRPFSSGESLVKQYLDTASWITLPSYLDWGSYQLEIAETRDPYEH